MSAADRIELYACMTPNVLKVMFMLGELNLPYRINHVRIYRGENFRDGFEKLHPLRKLPVLVDHDGADGAAQSVLESGAILLYLAEKAGRLLGEGAAERSVVIQWLMLQMSSVGPVFGQATHFNRAAPAGDGYARRRFVTQAMRLCELYDARLAVSPYLAGDNFSIADVATFPWLWRHPGMLGISMAAYPKLARWLTEIHARAGFQRAHPLYKEIVHVDQADLAQADAEVVDRFLGRGRWFLAD